MEAGATFWSTGLVAAALLWSLGGCVDPCSLAEYGTQDGPSPHSLQVSKNRVKPGERVNVTLKSHYDVKRFRKFLIQARDESDRIVGNFVEAGLHVKVQDCNGDGSTRDSMVNGDLAEKTAVYAAWKAPEDANPTDKVNFFYTIDNWKEQKSYDVEFTSFASRETASALATTVLPGLLAILFEAKFGFI